MAANRPVPLSGLSAADRHRSVSAAIPGAPGPAGGGMAIRLHAPLGVPADEKLLSSSASSDDGGAAGLNRLQMDSDSDSSSASGTPRESTAVKQPLTDSTGKGAVSAAGAHGVDSVAVSSRHNTLATVRAPFSGDLFPSIRAPSGAVIDPAVVPVDSDRPHTMPTVNRTHAAHSDASTAQSAPARSISLKQPPNPAAVQHRLARGGYLVKRGGFVKNWKKRYFVVRVGDKGTSLVYYENQQGAPIHLTICDHRLHSFLRLFHSAAHSVL